MLALNKKCSPGPNKSTYPHVDGGTVTTRLSARSIPRIESTRSKIMNASFSQSVDGDAPGGMSHCRFRKEFGNSPAIKPIPAHAPKRPYSPVDRGHTPSDHQAGRMGLSKLRPKNAIPAAGTKMTNPLTVLFSPKRRRPRNVFPLSSGILNRDENRDFSHHTCRIPTPRNAVISSAARITGSGPCTAWP